MLAILARGTSFRAFVAAHQGAAAAWRTDQNSVARLRGLRLTLALGYLSGSDIQPARGASD